jgi:ADP-heptose:LPS heptosyltransferase
MAPGGRLTIVASRSNADFARLAFPDDRILVFGRYPWSRLPLLARLALERFDVVVDFHSTFSTTSVLMALLSGASRRVGYWNNGPHRDLSRVVFNLGLEPAPEKMHESLKSMKVVQRLRPGKDPMPRAYAMPTAPMSLVRQVGLFFRACGIGPRDQVLAIHPTLQKGSNCWAPKNYLELLKRLSDIPRLKVLVVHGLGEDAPLKMFLAAASAEGLEVHALPETDVAYLLEAAKRFKVVVAGDSGLAHLLSLHSYVIEIFGPSEPDLWAPLGPHRVLRAKDHRCDSVKPTQVAAAVRSAMRRRK